MRPWPPLLRFRVIAVSRPHIAHLLVLPCYQAWFSAEHSFRCFFGTPVFDLNLRSQRSSPQVPFLPFLTMARNNKPSKRSKKPRSDPLLRSLKPSGPIGQLTLWLDRAIKLRRRPDDESLTALSRSVHADWVRSVVVCFVGSFSDPQSSSSRTRWSTLTILPLRTTLPTRPAVLSRPWPPMPSFLSLSSRGGSRRTIRLHTPLR